MIKLIIFLVICQIITSIDQEQREIKNPFLNFTNNCPESEQDECVSVMNYVNNSLETIAEYKNSILDLNENNPILENKAIYQQIKLLIYKKLDLLRQLEDL